MADENEIIGFSEEFAGLLVRIADRAGGPAAGKIFLIPERDLLAFEFTPGNPAEFDSLRGKPPVHVDFAVYSSGFVVRASAGG